MEKKSRTLSKTSSSHHLHAGNTIQCMRNKLKHNLYIFWGRFLLDLQFRKFALDRMYEEQGRASKKNKKKLTDVEIQLNKENNNCISKLRKVVHVHAIEVETHATRIWTRMQ